MHFLLVISGSVAAYKGLELIRLLVGRGDTVDVILTAGGARFITPLSVSSLTGRPTYTELFSLTDEIEMGHIRLTRQADCVVVAPASADLIAKLANGLADDLASTALLANNAPLYVAPAMNAQMWAHPATQRNLARIAADGARLIAPGAGLLACGEIGPGRMAEPAAIVAALGAGAGTLRGRHVIVTAGPTQEPLDPVRYLGNRSSGKQGYAIAAALAAQGARVTLVSGPVALDAPPGVDRRFAATAVEMRDAVQAALPADAFVAAAAVADWRPAQVADHKMKKRANAEPPAIRLAENPDILAGIATHPARPVLVVGFAVETDDLAAHAVAKRRQKGCDWLLANGPVFGSDDTDILFVDAHGAEPWGPLAKSDVAARLADRIAAHFSSSPRTESAA